MTRGIPPSTGRGRSSIAWAGVVVLLAGAPAAGQAPVREAGGNGPPAAEGGEWQAPRTPWGDPDLQGMWPLDYINGTPVQRPPEFGERRYLTDEEYAERAARLAALNARRSEEHTLNSSHVKISYAVFCLKKKNKQ